jgi:hypothetical protein
LRFFSSLQVTLLLAGGEEGKKRGNCDWPCLFRRLFHAPPLFLLSFGGAELVPALLWIVILELFNVIFV